jgi:hypothetical protein
VHIRVTLSYSEKELSHRDDEKYALKFGSTQEFLHGHNF